MQPRADTLRFSGTPFLGLAACKLREGGNRMCLLSASTGRPGSCLPLHGRRKSDSGPGREARKDMGDKEGQGDALPMVRGRQRLGYSFPQEAASTLQVGEGRPRRDRRPSWASRPSVTYPRQPWSTATCCPAGSLGPWDRGVCILRHSCLPPI